MTDQEYYERQLHHVEDQLQDVLIDISMPPTPFSQQGQDRLTERLRVAASIIADTRAAIRNTLRGSSEYSSFLKRDDTDDS